MPLLNYTTKIAADKTAAEIQKLLARAGAEAVMVRYSEHPTALSFLIPTQFGPRSFTLPVDPQPVYKVLLRQSSYGAKNKIPRSYATMEQAARVAWRITKDWIEAQLAIIETEMVTLEQVMLPYMDAGGGQTVYAALMAQNLALPSGEETNL